MSEEELDNLIICPKCHALHKIVELEDNSKAHCADCNAVLYKEDSCLVEKLIALSLSALLFFIISNSFMIVQIDLFGSEEFMNIPSMLLRLIDSGFYIVGIFLSLFLFILPFMTITIYLLLGLSYKYGFGGAYTKNLLITLSNIRLWNMVDIFLISILIAMVKLVELFALHLGIAFYSLIIYVLLDIYLSKSIRMFNLWREYERRY
ncbi:MAG: paraquat-inducible protein A [Campylobacterales bacterium]|nr:paraquat-inducible protein A [Campylobacterales bacterium]